MAHFGSPMVVSESPQAGNSPVVITLRTSNNVVPALVSAYVIEKAVWHNTSGTRSTCTIQEYDNDNNTVESEVSANVPANGQTTLGDQSEDDEVLRIDRNNQIRVEVGENQDLTLYIQPDDL